MKRAAVSNIIFSSSFLILEIFCIILSVRIYYASAMNKKKRIFSQCTFLSATLKKHLFKSSHNTLLHGRGQADETENLEHLLQTNSSQSFLYSKVRALFPSAELH
jgi:hypothetical protein